VSGPRDVPALRDALVASWDTGALGYPILTTMNDGTELHDIPTVGGLDWDPHILARPDLSYWWVEPEMCEVLHSAEGTLPADTMLEPELVPRGSGLIVFGSSLSGIESHTGDDSVRVDALLYGPVELPPYKVGQSPMAALAIASYHRIVDLLNADERAEFGALCGQHGDLWVPLGRSDWVLGTRLDDQHAPFIPPPSLASMIEDRRRLATLWLLTTQAGITDTTEYVPRPLIRRRAARRGAPSPTVQVIDVKHRSTSGNSGPGDEHRRITVRYLVSGHWRNQAYGPGRQYRRPKWISSHWRGPDDGPISSTKKVRVWK
jgi:hypothetical protein